MKKIIIILSIIFAAIILWCVSSYNSLVNQKEVYTAQWSQVENQYQRRYDLVPNLVNAIKGTLKQELDVFGEIANARTRYAGVKSNPNSTQDEKIQATVGMETSLARLLVITENYPELKSSILVQDLMVQIEGTENRVAVERQKYNDTIKSYNLNVKRFPGMIFANIFGFNEQSYFNSVEGASTAPKVDLGN